MTPIAIPFHHRRPSRAWSPLRWPGLLAGTLATAAAASGMRIVAPAAFQQLLDRVLPEPGSRQGTTIVVIAGFGAAALVIAAIGGSLMASRLAMRTEHALHTIRTAAFDRVYSPGTAAPSAHRTAVDKRVLDDIEQLTSYARWSWPVLIAGAGQAGVGVLTMLWYSWQLGLLTLLATVALVPEPLLGRRMIGLHLATRRLAGRVRSATAEVVLRAREARAYASGRQAAALLEDAAMAQDRNDAHAIRSSAAALAFREIVFGVALAAVSVTGTILGAHGGVTIGRLTAFLLALVLLISPAHSLVDTLNERRYAVASLRRLTRWLDSTDKPGEAGPVVGT